MSTNATPPIAAPHAPPVHPAGPALDRVHTSSRHAFPRITQSGRRTVLEAGPPSRLNVNTNSPLPIGRVLPELDVSGAHVASSLSLLWRRKREAMDNDGEGIGDQAGGEHGELARASWTGTRYVRQKVNPGTRDPYPGRSRMRSVVRIANWDKGEKKAQGQTHVESLGRGWCNLE